jgi:hypothetical protein
MVVCAFFWVFRISRCDRERPAAGIALRSKSDLKFATVRLGVGRIGLAGVFFDVAKEIRQKPKKGEMSST